MVQKMLARLSGDKSQPTKVKRRSSPEKEPLLPEGEELRRGEGEGESLTLPAQPPSPPAKEGEDID